MRLVADIRRGPDSSDPKFLQSCGNVLWFVANDGLRGDELYASDGGLGYLNRDAGDTANNNVLYEQRGEAGTRLAKDIRPGKGSSSPDHFVCLNNVLLFAATDDVHGRELWRAAWADVTDSSTLLRARRRGHPPRGRVFVPGVPRGPQERRLFCGGRRARRAGALEDGRDAIRYEISGRF